MKGLALTVALLALPASAGAQALTLNCHYEYEISNSYDPETPDREGPMSGAFSALVRMSEPDSARIEATTLGCSVYVGGFNEQKVGVACEVVTKTVAGIQFKDLLSINRINGEFLLVSFAGQSIRTYSGHCTPAKKLF